MERTIVDWKAEEKDLCEKLYQKLLGLTLLYPSSEDFRKCLSADMFAKPNQNGFLHAMHYLFNILDPQEFQKRFYWPITDKRSEAAFRTATVEYLKHINEKHNLQWKNIKSYLVVLPGGMKFITFMLDFVSFVIQQLTKQREKEITDIDPNFSQEVNMEVMVRKNNFLKNYASQYITELDTITENLQERKKYMESKFKQISSSSGIDLNALLSDEFYDSFEADNRKLYEEKFAKRINNIATLNAPMLELRNVFNNFEASELETNYIKALSSRLSEKGDENSPNSLEQTEVSSSIDLNMDNVDLNEIICTLNAIYKPLDSALHKCTENPELSDFVKEELDKTKSEFEDLENKITEFHKMVNGNKKRPETDTKSEFQTPIRGNMQSVLPVLDNSLLSKIVSTPPIKLNLTENATMARLPLLGDVKPKSVPTIANQSTILSASKNLNKSGNLNSTLNRSRIIDPMTLLRTINKMPDIKKTNKLNLSQLGLNCLEDQTISSLELNSNTLKIPNEIKGPNDQSCSNQTILYNSPSTTLVAPQSPHTPFSDRSRIIYNTVIETSGGSSSVPYSKKLSAVKKVQDVSLNFQNMSTSPSGRLDALVIADHAKETQKTLFTNEPSVNIETSTKEAVDTSTSKQSKNDIKQISTADELLINVDTPLKEIFETNTSKQSKNDIKRKPSVDELLINVDTPLKEIFETNTSKQSKNDIKRKPSVDELLINVDTPLKEIFETNTSKQSNNDIKRKPSVDELLINVDTPLKEILETNTSKQPKNDIKKTSSVDELLINVDTPLNEIAESNLNMENLEDQTLQQFESFDEESLFNISDSVLNDVPM